MLPELNSERLLIIAEISFITVYPRARLTDGGNGPPAEQFQDSSADVGQAIFIFECRHARSTDDTFKLLLALPWLLGIGDHGKQEPGNKRDGLQIVGNTKPAIGPRLTVTAPAPLPLCGSNFIIRSKETTDEIQTYYTEADSRAAPVPFGHLESCS